MEEVKITIGYDHRGRTLVSILKQLKIEGILFEECQYNKETHTDSLDYPYAAISTCKTLGDNKAILICGSGVGMSITANRIKHIRAAVCNNIIEVRTARQHSDINTLILSANNLESLTIKDLNILLEEMVKSFIETKFIAFEYKMEHYKKGEEHTWYSVDVKSRYKRRLELIEELL